jgi:hypothetical protein
MLGAEATQALLYANKARGMASVACDLRSMDQFSSLPQPRLMWPLQRKHCWARLVVCNSAANRKYKILMG